jgi:Uma2 family endonuclease
MAVTGRRMTAEELWRLPDDGLRHELVYGELRTMSPAGGEHGHVASNVHGSLFVHLRRRRLGRLFAAETGFLLARDPDLVRAPDVAFVRRERAEPAGRVRGYWPGAPDLAVEVVSPNDRPAEVAEKVQTWLAYGTLMVLVVYPDERRVQVHVPDRPPRELEETDVLDGGDVVPGWKVPVRAFFE